MAKDVTSPLIDAANQQYASEPITVVEIEWDDVTTHYGDKDLTIGTIIVQGTLIKFSTIANQRKTENSSDFSSVSIVLADTDGVLKAKVKTQMLESREATIYQYFEGLGVDDLAVLLKGRISGDIVWDEGDRTLSLSIEYYIEDNEVGFAPTEEDIPDIHKSAIDQPWPLCFGTVLKVPATHVLRPANGTVREMWISDVHGVRETILINGGSDFPQDIVIDIMVGDIRVRGIMTKDTFTVQEANLPVYTDIEILARQRGDVHFYDARVIWIQDDRTRLVGQYCSVNYEDDRGEEHFIVNYCIAQHGNKCYFQKPWQIIFDILDGSGASQTQFYYGQNVLLQPRNSPILETRGIPGATWSDSYWTLSGATWQPGGPNVTSTPTLKPFEAWQTQRVSRGYWGCPPGMFVQERTNYNDLYVANLIPSSRVFEVYARRKYRDEEIFVPVPSSYYIKHLAYNIAGQSVTALEFPQSLLSYRGENWDEGIYVSLISSQGPNASDIIKWLVESYSNIGVHESSFNTVRTYLGAVQANFALFTRPNVIGVCELIAKQSRCALLLGSGEVKIRYLSVIPTSEETFNNDNVDLKTLGLGFTTIDNIITRSTNNWLLDYSGDEEVEQKYNYKNNVDDFGLIESTADYFIYNIELFVKISAGFWGYRSSNIWRRALFTTYLNALELEMFDGVTVDVQELSQNPLLSDIDDYRHNTDYPPSIHLEIVAGARSGHSEDGEPVQDFNYWLGDPNYPADMDIPDIDLSDDRNEVDYVVPTDLEGDGADGTPDPDDDEDEFETAIVLFTSVPETVTRDVAYSIRIEIQDVFGSILNRNITAQLILESTDTADRIGVGAPGVNTSVLITFINGIYASSAQYISGGADVKQGTLTINAAGYLPVNSPPFIIRDATVGALAWTVCPGIAVVRETAFSVALEGGAAGQDVTIEFSGSDTRDRIYINGVKQTKIFTIVLDSAGEYASAVWMIRGGYRVPSAAMIIASDPNELLASDVCEIYEITGSSAVRISQSLDIDQEVFSGIDYVSDEYEPCLILSPSPEPPAPYFTLSLVDNSLTRSTDYTLWVQAMNGDHTLDELYFPGPSGVTLIADTEDSADAIIPNNLDMTNWVDGRRNVTFQITGGDPGVVAGTIRAIDPDDGREGQVFITLEALEINVTPLSGVDKTGIGGFQQLKDSALDSDPVADVHWSTVQSTDKSYLFASTHIWQKAYWGNSFTMMAISNYSKGSDGDTIHFEAGTLVLQQKLPITPADRLDAKYFTALFGIGISEAIRVPPYSSTDPDFETDHAYDLSHIRLCFKARYTDDYYASGYAAYSDITTNPDVVYTLGDVIAMKKALGHYPTSGVQDLTLLTSMLTSMPAASEVLYMWFCIDHLDYPQHPYKRPEYLSHNFNYSWPRGLDVDVDVSFKIRK